MTVNVQITPESISFNGISLNDLLEQAVLKGMEAAGKKLEDPLEMVTLAEVAKKFGCSLRTMTRRSEDNNVKVYKQGRNICIFKKDVEKLLKQY